MYGEDDESQAMDRVVSPKEVDEARSAGKTFLRLMVKVRANMTARDRAYYELGLRAAHLEEASCAPTTRTKTVTSPGASSIPRAGSTTRRSVDMSCPNRIEKTFLAGGRSYEVMLETSGRFKDMVHLIDARMLHDPFNWDVLITGAQWNGDEIVLGNADVFDEESRNVLPLASRVLREALEGR